MRFDKTFWGVCASTTLFVLLWSSGAIFARLGLDHASAFAFLALRFLLAFGVLLLVGALAHTWLPKRGLRLHTAGTGLLMIGSYPICYLLALDHGITPGVLATVLGVQPILTLMLLERRFAALRLAGLMLALCGLVLVVWQSIGLARFSLAGMAYALGALLFVTLGAIAQKGLDQSPLQALPLQYGVSLLLCGLFLPFQHLEVEWSLDFLLPLLWLGVGISVVAQLLLYRLIRAGNLVNVTSLFYLVPGVTAAMDYLFLGNAMSGLSLAGMAAILLGLMLVFRQPRASGAAPRLAEAD
ncbi:MULTISPECIES: DMT family transporter [unclassified Pseudomonas]|uniref:DMT family transporter n=1 Tax=unclassified Pseudomonas TaxID=196821 RepID=UPI002447DDFE|nr:MULTISPECIES: DMT family transporter [unclassified Pseudomonas]MDG9924634.1 DMT family transporter [Pseudomonas sp. GD04045]MDH0033493.1 DMT family transporter [Pseudomonas sp. GD04019]